ncbi:DNA2/NAM7 helicase, putative [Plasmodium ovale wallikeri]|uniref:DNA2/NAM7 helicase, putative n=1 Tax=Plasmodium ovale wallikeri TaxID=864142 RepID=A0A1A8YT13_PLAOA|nr:DNA2/NAM7 helicase, putative [Plasmodium ovale wallikeri]
MRIELRPWVNWEIGEGTKTTAYIFESSSVGVWGGRHAEQHKTGLAEMWEDWDDEHFVRVFFDWDILTKYAQDNEFKELEENIKKEHSSCTFFDLNEEVNGVMEAERGEKDEGCDDNPLLILHSLLEEKKYVDVSQYMVSIILRWNYYTSLRNEKELNICSVRNRLKINLNICTLPDVYKSFEEYFYSYFPLFLIETQQLINNKKENEDVKEYDVLITNDMKEMYNMEFHITIAYDDLIYSNIFYGDLILLRFVPKKTANRDAQYIYTPSFSTVLSKKKEETYTKNDSEDEEQNSYSDVASVEDSDNSNEIPITHGGDIQQMDGQLPRSKGNVLNLNCDGESGSSPSTVSHCADKVPIGKSNQRSGRGNIQEIDQAKGTENDQARGTVNDQAKGTVNDQAKGTEIDHAKGTEIDHAKGTEIDHAKGTEIDHAKGTEIDHAKGIENDQAKGTEIDQAKGTEIDQAKGPENDNIYMIRKYCVRHLLGYVVAKNKEKMKIIFNLNYKNYDIIDKVRKHIIYEIFTKEKLGDYFLRISKVTSLVSTLRQFNCFFNFRNSPILGEIVEVQGGEDENGKAKGDAKGERDEGVVSCNGLVGDDEAPISPLEKGNTLEKDTRREHQHEKLTGTQNRTLQSGSREGEEAQHNKQVDDEGVSEEDRVREKIKCYLNKLKLVKGKKMNGEHVSAQEGETSEEGKKERVERGRENMVSKSGHRDECAEVHLRTQEHRKTEEKGKTSPLQRDEEQYKGFNYIPVLLKNKFFDIYNEYQLSAINNSILNEGITLIQGPPGTGKTTTILGIISALIFFQKVEINAGYKENGNDITQDGERKKRKSPYAWMNYEKKNDYYYFNDNCFEALEYEDFFDHPCKNTEKEDQTIFHFKKSNRHENNNAYAIHLSIMNASNRTLRMEENGDVILDEEDVHKSNENRIKNLIGLTESYYNSYVNDEHIFKRRNVEEGEHLSEKLDYSYYVSDMRDMTFVQSEWENRDSFIRREKHQIICGESGGSVVSESVRPGVSNTKSRIDKINLIKNKKILVCAPSNAAIDEILRRLVSLNVGILDENGNAFNPIVTRIGGNVSTDLLEFSLEFKEQLYLFLSKRDENKIVKRNLLKTSTIICCTLSSSSNSSLINNLDYFDAIIIDEASQSVELDILIPLAFSCKKIILVGDPKQLSATVFSLFAKKKKYSRSLFERLQKKYKRNKSKFNLLSIQYRMHPDISHFPNKHYYKNKITDASYFLFTLFKEMEINKRIKCLNQNDGIREDKKMYIQNALCNFNLLNLMENNFGKLPSDLNDIILCQKNKGIIDWFFIPLLQHSVFYDISFSQQMKIKNSYINIEESEAVIQFIEFLHFIFSFEKVEEWYKKIGIITPYATEKYFLKKELKTFFTKYGYKNNVSNFIDIGTVDGFQGTEKDIIIFLCVRTKGALKRKKKGKKMVNQIGNINCDEVNTWMKHSSSDEGRTKIFNIRENELSEESSSEEEVGDSNLFFSNYKRLNVALTRARYNLFIFGNCSFLKKCDTWSKIINHYKRNNKIIKIKHNTFKKKKKHLSDDTINGNVFDEKKQMINKKIENSFYNRNIIDYNFIPTNEDEKRTFDLKSFLYSCDSYEREETNDEEEEDEEDIDDGEEATDDEEEVTDDGEEGIDDGEEVTDYGETSNETNDDESYENDDCCEANTRAGRREADEKEIMSFFKELYLDDFDKSKDALPEEGDEQERYSQTEGRSRGGEWQVEDKDQVEGRTVERNEGQENGGADLAISIGNTLSEQAKVIDLQNDEVITVDYGLSEKGNGQNVSCYNIEHFKVDTQLSPCVLERKENLNGELGATGGISKCKDALSNVSEGEHGAVYPGRESIIYEKNENYFVDTLFNFCKNSEELLFAVQCALPEFSKTFLRK